MSLAALAELAEVQQQQLSALLATVSNLREAIKWLGSADFRGFAHLLIRRAAGVITLEAVPQWYFNQPTGEEFYLNPEATSGAGELYEVPASLYICRRVPRPIDVVALFACVGKYNGEQGWSSFLDVFGNPAIFVEYPPGTSDERARELAAVVEELIGDARGGIPSGSKIQTVETAARGGETFGAYVEYYNKKIVLKGTGGLLTMLTESGSGTLAGGTHAEAFKSLGNASLQHIAEVLNTQWLEAELRRLFPNTPKLVELVLEYPAEKQQSEEVQTITALSAAGFKLDDAQVEENTGYKVEYREIQSAPTLYETKAVGFRPTEAAVADMTGLPMEPVPSHILNPRGEGINNRAPEHGETEEPPLTPAELAAFRAAGHVDEAFLNDRAEAAYKALESSALVSAAKTPKTPAARFAKPLQNGASNLLSRARRLFGGVVAIFNRCNQHKHEPGCTGGKGGKSRESRTKTENDWRKPKKGLTPDQNFKNVTRSLEWALKNNKSVNGVMHRDDLGWIDLPIGTSGKKNDDYKGGFGLNHFRAKHPDIIKELPNILVKGKTIPHSDPNKRTLLYENRVVHFVQAPKKRAWILTSFKDRRVKE